MGELRVATWNLFHGRAQPPVRADLLPDYASALSGADWDVCGLQECPPWFARPLAEACGASLQVVRTSWVRGALPAAQRRVSARDPERLGVKGAAVNALLVRPSAGVVGASRGAVLRSFPQGRSLQAVRVELPGGGETDDPRRSTNDADAPVDATPATSARSVSRAVWVGNVHTHNKPEAEASIDLVRAIEWMRTWADGAPFALLGDLNVQPETARAVAAANRLEWLAGDRVDHVLATPGISLAPGGSRHARRPKTLDGSAALSDHRLLLATLRLP